MPSREYIHMTLVEVQTNLYNRRERKKHYETYTSSAPASSLPKYPVFHFSSVHPTIVINTFTMRSSEFTVDVFEKKI